MSFPKNVPVAVPGRTCSPAVSMLWGISSVLHLAVCPADPGDVRRQSSAQMLRYLSAWSRVSEQAWVCQR